jgi:hypothetical protein
MSFEGVSENSVSITTLRCAGYLNHGDCNIPTQWSVFLKLDDFAQNSGGKRAGFDSHYCPHFKTSVGRRFPTNSRPGPGSRTFLSRRKPDLEYPYRRIALTACRSTNMQTLLADHCHFKRSEPITVMTRRAQPRIPEVKPKPTRNVSPPGTNQSDARAAVPTTEPMPSTGNSLTRKRI